VHVESIAAVTFGWTAGINAYITVLLLGLAGRFGWADTPAAFEKPWVLAATGAMFAIEFVVDKVPYLDSAWDTIHTFVRPVIGALVAVEVAGADLGDTPAALLGAVLALVGHGTKASTRLAINASPEPASNIAASITEDTLVVSLVVLAFNYPRLAAGATIVALVAGIVIVVLVWRLVRSAARRLFIRGQRPGQAQTRPR
jgi:Domain of unknown function (DUF4126)